MLGLGGSTFSELGLFWRGEKKFMLRAINIRINACNDISKASKILYYHDFMCRSVCLAVVVIFAHRCDWHTKSLIGM